MTPFDLVFRDLVSDLGALQVAARGAGRELGDRTAFARAPEVRGLLARLAPPADGPDAPGSREEYLTLLYAAYRFWEAGERVLVVPRSRLEAAITSPPPPGVPAIPGGACYLQLPPSWWWAKVTEDAAHEPLDGCFAVGGTRGDEITVVAVLGLRRERAGFTQVALTVSPADFADAAALRRDPPFAPLIEGGTSAGLHSLATPAELLTLVHLALAAAVE
jgi:hypothetical protein